MAITASSIYSRVGTAHLWIEHATNPALMRSWCGLVEKHKNLDTICWKALCSKCKKRSKSLG